MADERCFYAPEYNQTVHVFPEFGEERVCQCGQCQCPERPPGMGRIVWSRAHRDALADGAVVKDKPEDVDAETEPEGAQVPGPDTHEDAGARTEDGEAG